MDRTLSGAATVRARFDSIRFAIALFPHYTHTFRRGWRCACHWPFRVPRCSAPFRSADPSLY
eukprot:jgi/Psemu1/301713/fgenesh1_kg.43_\